jgi:hypothetical protein
VKNLRPVIAVIGGLWSLDSAHQAAAKSAAQLVGAELAKHGFRLTVYFSNEESLEPHVVSGYVAAARKHAAPTASIIVRYAESQRGQIRFNEEATKPDLFEHRLFPGQDWEAPFYRSLAEDDGVDAVLLLGGATSTLIAGQVAIARRLPMLAIDTFGGSAAKIWNQLALASHEEPRHSWGTRSAEAFVARLKQECVTAAAQRIEARRREIFFATATALRQRSVYIAVAFAALLTAFFFGVVHTPIIAVYPFIMLVGLVSAGATGAVARITRSSDICSKDPLTSLLLGAIAGFVVGLAYLIPQWVGAPGVLLPEATVVTATDKIRFTSAVLVALSAGVGFDTVFNRMQREANNAALGPSSVRRRE